MFKSTRVSKFRMTANTVFYFDKNILYGTSDDKWHDFWQLAQQKGIRGFYSPFTYIEIASGLYAEEKFQQNRRCFELIAEADLDVLEYPQMCLAKLLLGPAGIPDRLLRKWRQNYRFFRGTPDFILKFCKIRDDLDKEHIVNITNCSQNLETFINEFTKKESESLFVVNSVNGPFFKVKFDFSILKNYRKKYETKWIDSVSEMYTKLKNLNETPSFMKLFLDALIDISTMFIFNSKSCSAKLGNNWNNKKVDEKLKPLDAFYACYKHLINKGLTGGVKRNDFHDLGLLVYLGHGLQFITNDGKLARTIEGSSQRKQIMTFDEAFALIQE
ncbi:MAG: hypothetical protein WBB67_08655 [bacterium]